MTQEQNERLTQLLTSNFNVDELNEVTELLIIERDEYHERMKNNADIAVVGNQRELLIAFCEYLFTEMNYTTETNYTEEEQVDVFLKSNL